MSRYLAAISIACAVAAAAGPADKSNARENLADPTAVGTASAASPKIPLGPSAEAAARPIPSAKWKDTHAGLEEATSSDCVGCHDKAMATHAHPVEVDYGEASRRLPDDFRPIDHVRAQGLVLREGKVGCLTCHSPASPWAKFLAVPRAQARHAPTLAELRAEEPGDAPRAKAPAEPPKDGAEVSTRTLCEFCHVKS